MKVWLKVWWKPIWSKWYKKDNRSFSCFLFGDFSQSRWLLGNVIPQRDCWRRWERKTIKWMRELETGRI